MSYTRAKVERYNYHKFQPSADDDFFEMNRKEVENRKTGCFGPNRFIHYDP